MAVILTKTGAVALVVSAVSGFAAMLALGGGDGDGALTPRAHRIDVVVPPVDPRVEPAPRPRIQEPGPAEIWVGGDIVMFRNHTVARASELLADRGPLVRALEPLGRRGRTNDRMSPHWAVTLRFAEGSAPAGLAAIAAAFEAGFDRVIVTAHDEPVCTVDRAPTDAEIRAAKSVHDLCLTGGDVVSSHL